MATEPASASRVSFRCLIAYFLACLMAAVVQIGFVLPPQQVMLADANGLSAAGIWLLLTTLHVAIFAAPFAMIGLIWAERGAIRRWAFYAAFAVLIALAGWAMQVGQGGMPQFVAVYVLSVALASAVAAGTVYWAVAGRKAGRMTIATAQ